MWVDLTQPLNEKTPSWEKEGAFDLKVAKDYNADGYKTVAMQCTSGIGTHMDAPAHFFKEGRTIDQIGLRELILPAFVYHSERDLEAHQFVSYEDILRFEKRVGEIEPGSFFLIHTGWDRFYEKPNKYRNVGTQGLMRFPYLDEAAGRYLFERGVFGLGIDTLSPDPEGSQFPNHQLFLGNDRIIIENVANLRHMPQKGGHVMALPLLIAGGTEAPLRLVGRKA